MSHQASNLTTHKSDVMRSDEVHIPSSYMRWNTLEQASLNLEAELAYPLMVTLPSLAKILESDDRPG